MKGGHPPYIGFKGDLYFEKVTFFILETFDMMGLDPILGWPDPWASLSPVDHHGLEMEIFEFPSSSFTHSRSLALCKFELQGVSSNLARINPRLSWSCRFDGFEPGLSHQVISRLSYRLPWSCRFEGFEPGLFDQTISRFSWWLTYGLRGFHFINPFVLKPSPYMVDKILISADPPTLIRSSYSFRGV